MKLIGMLDSPFVRRVAISMRLLGLPFEHAAISVFRGFEALGLVALWQRGTRLSWPQPEGKALRQRPLGVAPLARTRVRAACRAIPCDDSVTLQPC